MLIYGDHLTPFGKCRVVLNEGKLCSLFFLLENDLSWDQALLPKHLQLKNQVRDDSTTAPFLESFLKQEKISLDLLDFHGTPFQVQVWHTLLTLPFGTTQSYQDVAQLSGYPKAIRAVAHAIAVNRICLLIPCHRVISKSGDIHHYRFGREIKASILAWERNYPKQKY